MIITSITSKVWLTIPNVRLLPCERVALDRGHRDPARLVPALPAGPQIACSYPPVRLAETDQIRSPVSNKIATAGMQPAHKSMQAKAVGTGLLSNRRFPVQKDASTLAPFYNPIFKPDFYV